MEIGVWLAALHITLVGFLASLRHSSVICKMMVMSLIDFLWESNELNEIVLSQCLQWPSRLWRRAWRNWGPRAPKAPGSCAQEEWGMLPSLVRWPVCADLLQGSSLVPSRCWQDSILAWYPMAEAGPWEPSYKESSVECSQCWVKGGAYFSDYTK